MSGMLPNLDYSRMVTRHREREMRDHVSRRSHAGGRMSTAAGKGQRAGSRPTPLRLHSALHLRHHGPAVRS